MQNGMARDASVTLTGASIAVLPLNGNRQFLYILNPVGNAPAAVNYTGPATGGTGPGGGVGNAAVLNGNGCVTLAAGEHLTVTEGQWCPQNPVNAIGTNTQHLIVFEG